ncbi:MAG: Ig-like domain repeat protein [Atopobiaceae bacterium]|nr:Ig-like domain repeat protein [Atopobiaceae bacterium]
MAKRKGLTCRALGMALLLLMTAICAVPQLAFAGTVTYSDDASATLDDPGTTYILLGDGSEHKNSNYFTVPSDKSSEANPIVVILDNVNRSQEGEDPDSSFLTIDSGNYVIIKLRGNNIIKAGTDDHIIDSDDGMAGIHVSTDSTVKVTSEEGDGSTEGSLDVHGGGGDKYGGAGIGSRYNRNCGTVIIAGGTIHAEGGHSAPGIGSGRDGVATDIRITGGNIYAQGGKYAPGVGSGDNVGTGEGGDLYDLSITGGTIEAHGGHNASGIGCSEGAHLHGTILIENATITAVAGENGAGIGCGDSGDMLDSGRVLIKSGTIKATGGEDGAGIGGGESSDTIRVVIDQTEGSKLSIEAQGGKDAAGIGSGDEDCELVDITLRGGTIVSYGGENGAGIGGGDCVDSIDIRGTGKIRTYGGQNGCGIGGGNNSDVRDHLVIEGDSTGVGDRGLYIWAEAGAGRSEDNQAAAIGSGKGGCCNITVKNAELVTTADNQGADIGGGSYHVTPGGTVDTITIDNCSIKSYSKRKVTAGIGAGYGATVNHINISNTEYEGGGIGGGLFAFNYVGLNTVKSITITNSNIHAEWDEEKPGDTPGDFAGFNKTPLDHGAAGIGAGLFGSMGNITIHDSTIYAKGFGSGAGIGGGGAGSNSSIFGLDKLDIGNVGTIEIYRSSVEAYSGCAQFKDGTPITVDTGYMIYTIDPAQMGSGAGIGSGSGSGVEVIDIQDCPKVIADSHSGAGIGGGRGSNMIVGGWVDHIYLINCGEVKATGGRLCAGIGTGGGDGLRGPQSCALKEIYINNCQKVTAKGGESAAGIGCGVASPYADADTRGGKTITIIDSTVTAKGGKGGAGIGGGLEQARTGIGGENPPILIQGNCRVEAYGGECNYYDGGASCDGGGAGIGGGSDGGASTIEIDITEDETTPHGYLGFPQDSNYYVYAEGGDGAAGIGSGGSSWMDAALVKNSNDSDSIYIKSGAVFARGGGTYHGADKREYDDGLFVGAGAGIGGGSAEGTVDLVKITGGYVQAEGGRSTEGSDKADDIGTGGDWSTEGTSERDSSGSLVIEDGTVFADRVVSFSGTRRITGGSVSGKIDGATDASGSPVYQTTAKLADAGGTKVSVQTAKSYGTNHIYTNGDGRVFLYLNQKGSLEDKSQWADFHVGEDTRHYIGYTTTDHTGVLKMDGKEVPFADPGTVRYGDDFDLSLQDSEGYQGAEWTFEVTGVVKQNDTGSMTTSPGAKLSLHADTFGAYTVSGISPYTPDDELYWGCKAHFDGYVSGADAAPAFTEDPSKVYDSQPVTDPSVTTPSDGKVTYTYYDSEGNQLDGAPTNAGSYSVTATVAASGIYAEGSCSKKFKISPAQTSMSLSFEVDGAAVVMKARVMGLYEADGSVHFHIYGSGTYSYIPDRDINVEDLGNGVFAATLSSDEVVRGNYQINARFDPSGLGNYRSSSKYEWRDKELADRSILGPDSYTVTYGSEPFMLEMTTDHPTKDNDSWFYDVSYDAYAQYGFEPAISVERRTGKVTVNHAGMATVKVTLDYNNRALYNKAIKYVTVEVLPAPLTVSSYAYMDGAKDEPLTTAHYGKLDSVRYGLAYGGLVGTDEPETFTHGHGYLQVKELPQSAGVGEHAIGIERCTDTAKPVTINGQTYENLFVSRDYEITYAQGTLDIKKARLAVAACQTQGVYGGAEPAYEWELPTAQEEHDCDGLAPWDSADTVFATDPAVTLDAEKAGGSFASLDAGSYPDVLVPSGGSAANYDLVYLSGTLVVDPANLGDTTRFEASASDTIYNGLRQEQPVTIVDHARGEGVTLAVGQDYTLAYPDAATDAGEVLVVATGVGNYTGARQVSYAITRAPVSVTTESASKPYDGTPLTAEGTVEGIAKPDAYTFGTTGSQTQIGWSHNGYELSFADEAKQDNYSITEHLGKLSVYSGKIEDCDVTDPQDVTYDGLEHKQDVTVRNALGQTLVEGSDYELSYVGSLVDAGTVTVSVTGIGAYSSSTDVSYRILPAPLVARTESASKTYDGKPLAADGKLQGLVNGETASFAVTGTITNPGTTPNSYTLTWDGSAKQANYELAEDVGTLTVVANINEHNTIEASDYRGVYDGAEHAIQGAATIPGSTISYSTDGGKTWSFEAPVFKDATVQDVKVLIRADHVGYLYGSAQKTVVVRIAPATLTVTTKSADRVYDGQTLTAEGSISGWVAGEGAPFAVVGAQTHAGGMANGYQIAWDDVAATAKQSNYQLQEDLGTLTVTPAPARLTTQSATKAYDGNALTAPGGLEGLMEGETAVVQVTGTQTEVGSSANAARILWEGTAREADYSVSTSIGTLEVTACEEPITITAPSVSKPYDGTPLVADGSDQANPVVVSGLIEGFTLQAVVQGSQTAVGSSANTISSYVIRNAAGEDRTSSFAQVTLVDGTLTVTQAPGKIEFVQSPTKVYDAKPAADPQVSYLGNGTLSFTYFDATGTKLAGAPTNAGTYEVEARVAQTTEYAAASERLAFVITPAPTTVRLALAQKGTSATATANVEGLYAAEGTVTFFVNNTQVGEPIAVTKDAEGQMLAAMTFGDVPTGSYTVRADFTPATGNYASSSASKVGNKDLATREIAGQTQRTATYGDAAFTLDLSAKDDCVTPQDSWTYAVVYDAYSTMGFEPAVSVADDGTVTVLHAGTAVIEATLSDGENTYQDASLYVAVQVSPANLTVRSQAYAKGTAVDAAVYGKLSSLTYGLTYKGLVAADEQAQDVTHGHGTLEAVPVDPASEVRNEAYPIEIRQVGASLTIGDTTYDNVFVARDYAITYQPGSLVVTPADLSDDARFAASAADVLYSGLAQEQPAQVTDLAAPSEQTLEEDRDYTLAYEGDTTNVGQVEVTVTGKNNYTGTCTCSYRIQPATLTAATGSATKQYDGAPLTAAGTLEGLVANETATLVTTGAQTTPGNSPNTYRIVWDGTAKQANYQVRATLGTLTVVPSQAPVILTAPSTSKTYDGTPLVATDPVTANGLPQGFEVRANVLGSQLDVGVSASVVDDDYAIIAPDGSNQTTSFANVSKVDGALTVTPARCVVRTPSVTKVYDGMPLTAEGTLEGLVAGETATLVTTGSQTEVGSSLNTYDLTWDGTAKQANYNLSEELGTLSVTETDSQIMVTTTGGSFVYDGKPHRASVSVSKLPAGYRVERAASSVVVTDATASAIDVTADTLVIVNAAGIDVTKQLDIAYVDGKLAVTPADLSVVTPDATKTYDATPLTAAGSLSGLVQNETARLVTTGAQTDAGSSPNSYKIVWDGTAKEGNYKVSDSVGTLTVEKTEAKVVTNSATKPYDGTPLVAEGTLEGLVAGETATLVTTGAQTEVGSSFNTYDLSWDGTAKQANYNLSEELGTLSVTPASDDANVIEVHDWQGVYDGQAHTIEATASLPGSVLSYSIDGGDTWSPEPPSVKDVTDGPLTVTVRATNSGSAQPEATATALLQVMPAPLTVVTKSASKPYDGTPLVAEGAVSGWVAGESAPFTVTGAQLHVGVSTNGYQIAWDGTDALSMGAYAEATAKAANYQVIEDLGTLDVNPMLLTVRTGSATKPYDGTPLTQDEAELEGLAEGETASVVATGSITEVGSVDNGYQITWGTARSDDYTLYEKLGTLTVTEPDEPQDPQLKFLTDPSKIYDAQPVQDPDVSYAGDGTLTLRYLDEEGTLLDGAPTNVGHYVVEAQLSATEHYLAAQARLEFVIAPAQTSTVLLASQEGSSATLTALVMGLVHPEGTVSFTVNGTMLAEDVAVVTDESGNNVAILQLDEVPEGSYNVEAAFAPATANYMASQDSRTLNKDLAQRSITGETTHAKTYGDGPFALEFTSDQASEGDVWVYEVAYDSSVAHGTDPVLEVAEDGVVTLQHVGSATVKVTLLDTLDTYDDAVTLVKVDVSPAPLMVRTESATKPYDGESLTAEGVLEGLVYDETVTLVVTGSQTEVGSSPNSYELVWDGTAKQENYELTEELGTLTVTEVEPEPEPDPKPDPEPGPTPTPDPQPQPTPTPQPTPAETPSQATTSTTTTRTQALPQTGEPTNHAGLLALLGLALLACGRLVYHGHICATCVGFLRMIKNRCEMHVEGRSV